MGQPFPWSQDGSAHDCPYRREAHVLTEERDALYKSLEELLGNTGFCPSPLGCGDPRCYRTGVVAKARDLLGRSAKAGSAK